MQVSVEATGGLQRRMTINLPKERVDQEYQTRLRSLARKTRINGFRPGKVPVRIVQQRFGEQVRQEVIDEVVKQTLQEAMTQEKVRLASEPALESIDDKDDNEGFAYSVTFEVYPEVDELQLDGIQIEKPVVEISDTDVDHMIESLRKQRQTWDQVEREAQEGDLVVVDYSATLDGEAFEGGNATQQQVVIGSGRYLKQFEAGLVGARAGTALELDAEFPADYPAPQFAGKTAHFSVTVHKVSAPQLPEIDEEFASVFGVTEGGVEVMRAEIRKNLTTERDKEIRNKLKQQLFNTLMAKNPVEVPEALIKQESKHLAENFTHEMAAQGVRLNREFEPERFAERARTRVQIGLLVGQIVRDQNMNPNPAKVREMVEELAASYEDPQAFIKWHYAEAGRLAEVETAVLEEAVVEWLLERAEVTEKHMNFDELLAERRRSAATPIA